MTEPWETVRDELRTVGERDRGQRYYELLAEQRGLVTAGTYDAPAAERATQSGFAEVVSRRANPSAWAQAEHAHAAMAIARAEDAR